MATARIAILAPLPSLAYAMVRCPGSAKLSKRINLFFPVQMIVRPGAALCDGAPRLR